MAKQNRKATLVRYARINGIGWRRGSIVSAKNGRVKPDAMLYAGREHPVANDSVYQIRYYEGEKAKYTSVGSDYEEATGMLKKYLAARQLEAAQEVLGLCKQEEPKKEPEKEPAKSLTDLVIEYIAKKKSPSLNLSMTSIRHYEDTLPDFVRICGRNCATEVTEEDITSYMDTLTREGYSQKTRTMRYTTLRGFLRSCDLDLGKLVDSSNHKRLSLKPEGNTDPYTQRELDGLFAACSDYHRIIFTFLLATGLRYREANHLTWSNIDFERNTITVPFHQRVNRKYHNRMVGKVVTKTVEFKVKSRRKREVPIFASLRPLLVEWRNRHPERVYVFGSRRSDMPDNHWLQYGKRAWRKAGMNCGVCDGCKKEECEAFFLHKFRHTFAHRCLEAGIPIHKVSRWLGHHSIEVTAIYLTGGSNSADQDPFAKVDAA